MTPNTSSEEELRKKMGYLGFEWNKWDKSFSMHGTMFRVKPGDARELIKHFNRFLLNREADRKKHELQARINGILFAKNHFQDFCNEKEHQKITSHVASLEQELESYE